MDLAELADASRIGVGWPRSALDPDTGRVNQFREVHYFSSSFLNSLVSSGTTSKRSATIP